ncbi:BAG4 regulator, partial [Upupa epops]|nr:BAG4 regulator [Upupa epops]
FPPPQMDSPYANGAYSPPYPPAPGAAPHYSSLPQPRGYYCSGPPHTPYPAAVYRPPSPAPPWSYAPPDCPTEGSSLRRPQVPGYSPPETPGMRVPQYPYGDGNPGLSAQGPPAQPRGAEDAWGTPPAYGVQPAYAWPAAPGRGSPFVSESHPAWPGGAAPGLPPGWDCKVPLALPPAKPHGGAKLSGGRGAERGFLSSSAPPRVQYSAQPQLYDTAPRRPAGAAAKAAEQPAAAGAALQPEIQRILRVMGEAELLEQEVDEFVGKKTDKSYRLLEEMLTKLLLELDSIETGGQDGVRQARKESVHRVQALLDTLERKGL